jgi:hypothetical protein
MTLQSIMDELEKRVINDEPVSPASWVEAAIRVNVLRGELDNKVAEMEAMMADFEAVRISEGDTSAKAKILAKTAIPYKEYLNLRAYLKRIDEFIRLAKRRSAINEF